MIEVAARKGLSSAQRYVLKDFTGSSHRILADWVHALPAGARILELGPGIGPVARLARRDDLHWLGLESCLGCLEDLHQVLSGGAILDLESLVSLPRSPVILAADTLEHLRDPERMLRAAHAALPPGGLLMLSVPNVANVYVRLNLLFGRFPYADRGILDRTHCYFFTARSLEAMVEAAGFVVERRATSVIPIPLAFPRLPDFVQRPSLRALAWLTRLFPSLLGYQLLLILRRS